MTTPNELEKLTRTFADSRSVLCKAVGELNASIEALKRKHIPVIKLRVAQAASAHDELAAAIKEAPELFVKPRSMIVHGVRIGWQKAKGTIAMDDEAAVIGRIRKLLPDEQAELLIRVKESVHKPAVYDLSAGDLKRLGIRIEGDGDQPFIKPTDSEVDKLVDALLKGAAEQDA